MKDEDEIKAMLDKVYHMTDFPGMTYQEGLEYALRWVLGDYDEDPTE